MSIGTLLVRADASPAMGTGHVMRSLALAQAWQDAGGCAVFVMAENTLAVRARLLSESCGVVSLPALPESEDAKFISSLARERGAQWIVVDGYQFGTDYQRALKAAEFKTLVVDDYAHAGSYCADFVLNQNLGVSEELYPNRGKDTRLLLGSRYSLLRREFATWRNWERKIPKMASRLLVTMGGSDPANVTAAVVEALGMLAIDGIESLILAGGSNPRFKSLQELVRDAGGEPGKRFTLVKDLFDMPERMAWADVAVSAAGSTSWEICLLGLPAILVDVAENQTAVARELGRLGCAIHLGNAQSASPRRIAAALERLIRSEELRSLLSTEARKHVDGFGSARVVSLMSGSPQIHLRKAEAEDARILWEWANDPEVRAASFSPAMISWEEHMTWFEKKRASSDCLILIAQDGQGTDFGQIRFDRRSDGDFEVGISIARAQRGLGMATILIRKGLSRFLEAHAHVRVIARVKRTNEASMRAFQRAGFENKDPNKGGSADELIYEAR